MPPILILLILGAVLFIARCSYVHRTTNAFPRSYRIRTALDLGIVEYCVERLDAFGPLRVWNVDDRCVSLESARNRIATLVARDKVEAEFTPETFTP